MKKVVTVFERKRYVSEPDGKEARLEMPAGLMTIIGGADLLRWEATVYAKSSSNAQLILTFYEGTKLESRPSLNSYSGQQLSTTTITTLGLTYNNITGNFSGLVDAIIGVKSSGTPPTAPEWVDAEVRLTATYS